MCAVSVGVGAVLRRELALPVERDGLAGRGAAAQPARRTVPGQAARALRHRRGHPLQPSRVTLNIPCILQQQPSGIKLAFYHNIL